MAQPLQQESARAQRPRALLGHSSRPLGASIRPPVMGRSDASQRRCPSRRSAPGAAG
jgi:hypothetical protein